MSDVIVFKAVSQAGTPVTVGQIPTSGVNFSTLNIRALNRNTSGTEAKISVAICLNPTAIDPSEYIEDGAKIPLAGGVFERTCFLAAPGEYIVVTCDQAGVSIRVDGLIKPQ